MRTRRYTENTGLHVMKAEMDALKEYAKRRRCTVSEYFREVAVQPLMERLAEVQDGDLLSVRTEQG